MERKEAEKKLENHSMSTFASECDICGMHYDFSCTCGIEDTNVSESDSLISSHILDVLFGEEVIVKPKRHKRKMGVDYIHSDEDEC